MFPIQSWPVHSRSLSLYLARSLAYTYTSCGRLSVIHKIFRISSLLHFVWSHFMYIYVYLINTTATGCVCVRVQSSWNYSHRTAMEWNVAAAVAEWLFKSRIVQRAGYFGRTHIHNGPNKCANWNSCITISNIHKFSTHLAALRQMAWAKDDTYTESERQRERRRERHWNGTLWNRKKKKRRECERVRERNSLNHRETKIIGPFCLAHFMFLFKSNSYARTRQA